MVCLLDLPAPLFWREGRRGRRRAGAARRPARGCPPQPPRLRWRFGRLVEMLRQSLVARGPC
eukprot:942891-Alexandrium_andersonii.AAC.1